MTTPLGPTSHFYYSQRLRLHYVDWGNPDGPPLLLVHGGRDHCRNWDWVAEALRDEYHIVAPDLRGHGDSEWVHGGSYTMWDQVYDLAQLVEQLDMGPANVVAHSRGGAIALHYAGAFPEHFRKLVAIEGMGMVLRDDWAEKSAAERVREWRKGTLEMAGRAPRRYATQDDAVERMQKENPRLSPDQARHLAVYGSAQNEDGTYSWKFDNYVRNGFMLIDQAGAQALWSDIRCPTLLIHGGESFAKDARAAEVARYVPLARVEVIEDAGHWVHHDQLDRFVTMVREFLAE